MKEALLYLGLSLLTATPMLADDQPGLPVSVPGSKVEDQFRASSVRYCLLTTTAKYVLRGAWYPRIIRELIPLQSLKFDNKTEKTSIIYIRGKFVDPEYIGSHFLGISVHEFKGESFVYLYDYQSSPEDFIRRVRDARVKGAEQADDGVRDK